MSNNTLRSGLVTKVTADGLWIEIPEIAPMMEFGPMEMGPFEVDEGDRVLVAQVSGSLEDFVVICPLVMSYTAPPPPVPYTPPVNASFVLYYENTAARTAASLTLVPGLTTWLDDEQRLEIYTDEGTPGWTQVYAWKSGTLAIPTASKIGVGVTSPGATMESASALTSDPFLRARVTGNANPRLTVAHDGTFQWGDGTAAVDVTVQRNASVAGLQVGPRFSVGGNPSVNSNTTLRNSTDQAGVLIENTLNAARTWAHIHVVDSGTASNNFVQTQTPSDSFPRFTHRINGRLDWGNGTAAQDVNLYRQTVDELKTDDSFTVGGNLAVTGVFDGVERWVNGVGINANSSAIGNTETAVMTLSSFTFLAGHVYSVELIGKFTASVATNRPTFRIRKTNTSGTELYQTSLPAIAASVQHDAGFRTQFKVGGSDVTAVALLSIQGSGSFNAVLLSGAILNVYDAGLAASRPSSITNVLVAI